MVRVRGGGGIVGKGVGKEESAIAICFNNLIKLNENP